MEEVPRDWEESEKFQEDSGTLVKQERATARWFESYNEQEKFGIMRSASRSSPEDFQQEHLRIINMVSAIDIGRSGGGG